jgi:NADPH:quinone reductase-like Zn-dependent oxidoreductase
VKAAVYRRYGPPEVIRIEEVDNPFPGDREVLIAVRAASVNPLDAHLMKGRPMIARLALGVLAPKRTRPGVDVAGVVEAVGAGVTRFRPGDAVFGSCRGAFAEYVLGRETAVVAKPARLSFEQAAAIPAAGATALQALRGLQAGQKVLVNGAAGGVGTFAVQIAKALGAEVTGVCSTRNVELVRSIGADHVVDYTVDDFTRSGERYDLIVNAVDSRSSRDLRRALTPAGRVVLVAGGLDQLLGGVLLRPFMKKKVLPFMAGIKKEDLLLLKDMVDTGKVTPVIDRAYPLAETPEAIRYVEAGHARGKVVVTVMA